MPLNCRSVAHIGSTTLLIVISLLSYVGCGGELTDQTERIQHAVDRGGVITFPSGTYLFTKTIVVHRSHTIIQGVGPATRFIFKPSPPFVNCVNDRAFTTPCDIQRSVAGTVVTWTPRRRIAQAIAVGDTGFTTVDAISGVNPGDWLIVQERDPNIGDVVVIDWVQVAWASGHTIATRRPFRTAFPNARPWDPIFSGLGFLDASQPIQGIVFRNFSLYVPDAQTGMGGISIFAAMDTVIGNVSVRDVNGQPLYSYMSKGLTVRNSIGTCGHILNEFAATVELTLRLNTLSCDHSAGFGLDEGSAFFSLTGNLVSSSEDSGVYFLHGVHDGSMSENTIAFVRSEAPSYSSVGILARGTVRTHIFGNMLIGGAGPASIGISVGDDSYLAVPIASQSNIISPNSFGTQWSADYDPSSKP